MTTNSLAEIEAEIASKKEEIRNVHGTDSEVYARIVGYYRPVRNWNKGKAEEYTQRKLYEIDNKETESKLTIEVSNTPEATLFDKVEETTPASTEDFTSKENVSSLHYEFFSRKTCPNCPPVREYLTNIKDTVINIDVDSKDGLARASELGVFAAPTVILFNGTNEIGRAHSTTELENLVKKIA